MSFILDALKKSESERQRRSGPALFEVRVAPPRTRFGVWAIVLGSLLAINFIVVGWLLLRRSAAPQNPVTAAASAPTVGPAPSPATVTTAPSIPAAPPAVSPAPAAALAAVTPPDAADSADDLAPAVEPTDAGRAGGRTASDSAASLNASQNTGVTRATASGLPSYQDALAAPGANIPSLKLDFLAYSTDASQRFVFINMTKLQEGESLPQGVKVESILPDGVTLSFNGSRFVLQP